MVYKNFYFNIITRIGLIFLTSLWLAFEISTPPNFYTILSLGSILILQVYALIHYVNKTNRELARFFISLRDRDSSFTIAPEEKTGSFHELARLLNETGKIIRNARIESEKQFQYFQFVVGHVDIGLISYRPDGKVIHCNQAAKNLLQMRTPKHINA
ncbi:MAG: hypothetical protein KAU83_13000, partial [Bacteroidales bacterium]|nr:hypothetical protein [Bacteroidales bacterium]